MKKKIGRMDILFFSITTLVLVVVLVFSSGIISRIYIDQQGVRMTEIQGRVSIDSLQNESVVAYLYDDVPVLAANTIEYALFTGWAYCKDMPEYDFICDNKYVDIILFDALSSHGYRISTTMYDDQFYFDACDTNRFTLRLPLVAIDDGEYSIYVYNHDTEEHDGIEKMAYYLHVQKSKYWVDDIFRSTEVAVDEHQLEYDVGLLEGKDETTQEKGYIRYQGWILKEGLSCDERVVYLGFWDINGQLRCFTTTPVKREGLSALSLNPDDYLYAGYQANIRIEDYPEIDFASQQPITLVEHGSQYLSPRVGESQPVAVDESLIVYDPDLVGSAETVQQDQNSMLYEGWIIKAGLSCEDRTVILALRDIHGQPVYFTTSVIKREGLSVVTPNPDDYLYSGYKAMIPMDDYPQIDFANQDVIALVEYGGQYLSMRVGNSRTVTIDEDRIANDPDIIGCAVIADLDQTSMLYEGWVIREGLPCTKRTVYLALVDKYGQKVYFSTSVIKREGLSVVTPNPDDYLYSGYKAVIPMSDYPEIDFTHQEAMPVIYYYGAYLIPDVLY